MDYRVHGILQARILEVGILSLLQGIFPTQELGPRSPALQADSLPAEPQGSLVIDEGKDFEARKYNWGFITSLVKVAQSCLTLGNTMFYTVHGILQARILEVGSLSLLGIFPTQGSNPGLPHCRRILYQLSYKESPRILEWVAYPFLQWIFLTQE